MCHRKVLLKLCESCHSPLGCHVSPWSYCNYALTPAGQDELTHQHAQDRQQLRPANTHQHQLHSQRQTSPSPSPARTSFSTTTTTSTSADNSSLRSSSLSLSHSARPSSLYSSSQHSQSQSPSHSARPSRDIYVQNGITHIYDPSTNFLEGKPLGALGSLKFGLRGKGKGGFLGSRVDLRGDAGRSGGGSSGVGGGGELKEVKPEKEKEEFIRPGGGIGAGRRNMKPLSTATSESSSSPSPAPVDRAREHTLHPKPSSANINVNTNMNISWGRADGYVETTDVDSLASRSTGTDNVFGRGEEEWGARGRAMTSGSAHGARDVGRKGNWEGNYELEEFGERQYQYQQQQQQHYQRIGSVNAGSSPLIPITGTLQPNTHTHNLRPPARASTTSSHTPSTYGSHSQSDESASSNPCSPVLTPTGLGGQEGLLFFDPGRKGGVTAGSGEGLRKRVGGGFAEFGVGDGVGVEDDFEEMIIGEDGRGRTTARSEQRNPNIVIESESTNALLPHTHAQHQYPPPISPSRRSSSAHPHPSFHAQLEPSLPKDMHRSSAGIVPCRNAKSERVNYAEEVEGKSRGSGTGLGGRAERMDSTGGGRGLF